MKNTHSSYLGFLLNKARQKNLKSFDKGVGISEGQKYPDGFNAKQWLTYLLHQDAELEQGLMIQYLYAAYSIGGSHLPEEDQEEVKRWQEILLGIAKEEMGHFITVQNVLRSIGAPLHFDRQKFPWSSVLQPFGFTLEPFSLSSLAKYLYAESPKGWLENTTSDSKEIKQIKKEVKNVIGKIPYGDSVSILFEEIINLIKDKDELPRSTFLTETFDFQAKFDEWGRSYKDGARGNAMGANPPKTPNVLVDPIRSRTDAIAALEEIAEQGEASSPTDNEQSHFERFLSIYIDFRKKPKGWSPSRKLATNPVLSNETKQPDLDLLKGDEARAWAALFDLRYRMLLAFLYHSFLLDNDLNQYGKIAPRGMIVHASFGEMYNLRAISGILVQIPIEDGSEFFAGPTFSVPYTLNLPFGEASRWRSHLDLIIASKDIIHKIRALDSSNKHEKYLTSLEEADKTLAATANSIIQSNA